MKEGVPASHIIPGLVFEERISVDD